VVEEDSFGTQMLFELLKREVRDQPRERENNKPSPFLYISAATKKFYFYYIFFRPFFAKLNPGEIRATSGRRSQGKICTG